MPRTKATKAVSKKSRNKEIANLIQCFNERVDERRLELINQSLKYESEVLRQLDCLKCTILESVASKTLIELKQSKCSEIIATVCEDSISNVKEMKSTIKKDKKLPATKRSRSYADDDGYITAESLGSQKTSGRVSRSRQKKPRTEIKRLSRSVSSSKVQKPVLTCKTPIMKNNVPSTFGMVTPKMKPNTPQVVLRRPKEGEVAISLQGSPLMVNPLVSEKIASINIPFQDGKVLSIQPQRGLRISQIPEMDEISMRQLRTLRDNLNKVCAMNIKK